MSSWDRSSLDWSSRYRNCFCHKFFWIQILLLHSKFVNNFFGDQNFFWDKKIFYTKFCGTLHFFGPNLLSDSKICWTQNFFVSKTFLDRKFSWNKNFVEPKIFWTQIFWIQNFLDPNLFGLNFLDKFCLPPIFLTYFFYPNCFRPKYFLRPKIFSDTQFWILNIKLYCNATLTKMHLRLEFVSGVGPPYFQFL